MYPLKKPLMGKTTTTDDVKHFNYVFEFFFLSKNEQLLLNTN